MYDLNVQAVVLRRSLTAVQSISLVPEAHTLPLKPFSPQGASVLISNASVITFLRVCLACLCDWDVMKGCVSEGIPPCGDGDSALSCLCSVCHMKEVNDSIYITSCVKFSVGVPQGVWDINHRCPFHLISPVFGCLHITYTSDS